MSQFAFLQAEIPDIFGHASRAESLARADPRATAFDCRQSLETAVGSLYRHDRTLKSPFEPTLAAHLAEPSFQALVGRTLTVKARFVEDTRHGVIARHDSDGPPGKTDYVPNRPLKSSKAALLHGNPRRFRRPALCPCSGLLPWWIVQWQSPEMRAEPAALVQGQVPSSDRSTSAH